MIAQLVADAHAAMQADDPAASIRLLVAAWREVPHPQLADAIEALSARADRAAGPFPLDGADDDQREAAWRALAARDDAAARHALLATLGEGIRDARLAILAPHGDPRVARAIADLLANRVSGIPITSSLFDHLDALRDPRLVPRLFDLRLGVVLQKRRGSRGTRERQASDRVEAIVTAAAARVQAAPLGEAATAHLAAIVALATAPDPAALAAAATEGMLLAAIYASPDDDGPRAVYADWLLEHGDPRGEFIARQLARTPDDDYRAMQILLNNHARFCGPLAPYLTSHTVVMERGFAARGSLAGDEAAIRAIPAMPAWATLVALDGGVPASDAHPMPALRTATGLGRFHLEHLVALAHPPPIEHLGAIIGSWSRAGEPDDDTRASIAAFAALQLPSLVHLELSPRATWADASTGPRGMPWPWRRALAALTVPAHPALVGEWLAAATASALLRLHLVPMNLDYRVALTRPATAATTWRLAIHPKRRTKDRPQDLELLLDALDTIEPGALAGLDLEVHANTWRVATRERFRDLLARHPLVDPAGTPTYKAPR